MLEAIDGTDNVFEWKGGFPKTKEFVIKDMTDAGFDGENYINTHLNSELPPAFEALNNKVVCIRDYISEKKTRNSYRELISALNYLNIKDFSLLKGTFKDKHNRDVKLTKLFDPSSQARKDLEKAKSAGLYILFTNDPYMRYTISTGRNWTSCMRMNYDNNRVKLVMSKGYHMISYLIDESSDFDSLEGVDGRFIIGLGGNRADVLAGHMLKHNSSNDSRHNEKEVIELLKQKGIVNPDQPLKVFCPICGDRIIETKKPDPQKFNRWLEGRLYTTKSQLQQQFSEIINKTDTVLADEFNVRRATNSVHDYYIHGEGIPYPEGQLTGALTTP